MHLFPEAHSPPSQAITLLWRPCGNRQSTAWRASSRVSTTIWLPDRAIRTAPNSYSQRLLPRRGTHSSPGRSKPPAHCEIITLTQRPDGVSREIEDGPSFGRLGAPQELLRFVTPKRQELASCARLGCGHRAPPLFTRLEILHFDRQLAFRHIVRLRSEVGGAGGFACQPAPDHGPSAAVTGFSSIEWMIRSYSLLLPTQ